MAWHNREPDRMRPRPFLEAVKIEIPHVLAARLDLFPRFYLGVQKRSQHVGRQIAGSKIDPTIPVYLTTEEPAAIGSLLPQNLGALDVGWIVDQQRAPFAAREILGFMKAQRRQAAERP